MKVQNNVATSLDEAKNANLKQYYTNCKVHGRVPHHVHRNACCECVKGWAKRRRAENRNNIRGREVVSGIKRRCKLSGIEFSVDETILAGTLANTSVCEILGIPIKLSNCHADDYSASVDRCDSSVGYTDENVTIVSMRANRIKNDGTGLEHLKIAVWQLKKDGLTLEQILDLVQTLSV